MRGLGDDLPLIKGAQPRQNSLLLPPANGLSNIAQIAHHGETVRGPIQGMALLWLFSSLECWWFGGVIGEMSEPLHANYFDVDGPTDVTDGLISSSLIS